MLQASLVGKTALVTGGGSGIGAKIVEVLVDAGAEELGFTCSGTGEYQKRSIDMFCGSGLGFI